MESLEPRGCQELEERWEPPIVMNDSQANKLFGCNSGNERAQKECKCNDKCKTNV